MESLWKTCRGGEWGRRWAGWPGSGVVRDGWPGSGVVRDGWPGSGVVRDGWPGSGVVRDGWPGSGVVRDGWPGSGVVRDGWPGSGVVWACGCWVRCGDRAEQDAGAAQGALAGFLSERKNA